MDFIIRKQYNFSRDVYPQDLHENSNNLGTLKQYYKVFKKVIKVFISLKVGLSPSKKKLHYLLD